MMITEFLIIFAARWLIYIALMVLPYLWFKGKRAGAVRVVISVAAAIALEKALDLLIYAPRPFVAGGFEPLISVPLSEYYASFPSGHATFMAALGTAAFFSDRLLGGLISVLAVLTGVGRVLARVHYPIDIVGGFFVGTSVSILIKLMLDRLRA